ncbi:hypothetical protein Moror_10609 [Moniliophthora roreri MCA 2997]|uniref:Uncharacterized protein n=1 Tax=Moniliophthora roreri (strain MCA 2997) TaxID=1381753 RepID=V2XH12_MONRO|nr:hypothetical protein Moror_10609 [Moniliophthora roreri MCA 2997]
MLIITQECPSTPNLGCSCTKSGTVKPLPGQTAPIRLILLLFAFAAVSTVHTSPLMNTSSRNVRPGYVSSRFIRRQDLGGLSIATENAPSNLADAADDASTTARILLEKL